MDRRDQAISPFMSFPRHHWAQLRADTPLTLAADELEVLRGVNAPVSLSEVEAVYLPLSRLLSFHVSARRKLFRDTQKFLNSRQAKVPFIIGMAGSVAVGKSTTARILQKLLARWPDHPMVALVPTDGFLRPNAELRDKGLMDKKGFPESYDVKALLRFVSDVKAGVSPVRAPTYSHLLYDVLPDAMTVENIDVLILEGLNVLQTPNTGPSGRPVAHVSDYFDFSIFLDADEEALRQWYVERFFSLRATAFRDPRSFFHRYAQLSDARTRAIANDIWERTNLPNLHRNILPTRPRADLILHKGDDHRIDRVSLRKL